MMGTKITAFRLRAEIRFKVQHGPWKVRLFRTNAGGNGLLSMTDEGKWTEHRAGRTDDVGTLFDGWSVDNVIAAKQLAMRLGFEGCVAIDGDVDHTLWWQPKSEVAACSEGPASPPCEAVTCTADAADELQRSCAA